MVQQKMELQDSQELLQKELGKYGVTANAISPGANTRMTQSVPDSTRAMRAGETSLQRKIILSMILKM